MGETIFFRRGWKPEEELRLNKEEVAHLRALRIFSETKNLRILDGNGADCFYEVKAGSDRGILRKTEIHPKERFVAGIATAIPKGNRLEWLLQKGTELGLTHFYFLNFEQSDRRDFNLERSLKITEEAAAQSKRIFLPSVRGPLSLREFLEDPGTRNEDRVSLYRLDPRGESNLKPEFFRNTIWLIGPEGGFRKAELELLDEKDVPGVQAGNSILKIETAGLFAASLFRFFTYSKNCTSETN
ncbi:16S rRNA (uracil(1498)-N(3))-methyltransferase [Leptospira gomenensis]|uniref:Ribosomal RNA small subunit methyltransferase E n=1 Tax=Leptospira gomenensis TaxID=2484974 RepID=A0A5F1Z2Z7_9LEPT|nr:16S rRNA (uracil(1498)-N(3))-methyltransferase [Leptospira gomenensis]TGK35493.1 16S rRNA (uracil(1498)-N(3))-methyltransferase [Leptospira gomenensis]TGK40615.1 16S rRNA (uracil(1498)-N(3))-methyltransferase [Leptospira gomenensis]TGK46293.1 16S rRNA (uracil(1498)-N(3))-methyltransferase [Leptospira gomenensis]TGK66428.1 16S rRNA (uracil(1498)-N(3))-methyltransferase [Leptospira gomenensis]